MCLLHLSSMSSVPQKKSILVVDDDPTVCDVLAAILESAGYLVIPAYSGEEALELFGVTCIDVVITDIQMGGMDGFELLTRIHNLDSHIKVIVMTAFGGKDVILKSLQRGAFDYIEKPLVEHSRIINSIVKAYDCVTLERDNHRLIEKLKQSHRDLAEANTQLKSVNDQLEMLARTDSLTGIDNRRHIDELLAREIARFQRYKHPFAILLIDIDAFKAYNDEFGHAGGDTALKHMADLLLENSRTSDRVGRFGGEEFFMLLSDTGVDGAKIVAERVRESVAKSILTLDGVETRLTISIGVACVDAQHPASNADELLRCSDMALYQAKRNGRNRVEFYDETMDMSGYQKTG